MSILKNLVLTFTAEWTGTSRVKCLVKGYHTGVCLGFNLTTLELYVNHARCPTHTTQDKNCLSSVFLLFEKETGFSKVSNAAI